ncbi:hypothetical protein VR46_18940, partial [Streptomyces sp. NRRL S-444]
MGGHVPWRHVLPPPQPRRHTRRPGLRRPGHGPGGLAGQSRGRAAARARRQLPGRLSPLRPVRR